MIAPRWQFPAILAAMLFQGTARADDDNKFPTPYDSEKSTAKPLPPAEAARGFRVPEGFSVDVFASEPEVRNPIAMTWDGRGRLWIAENFTYSEREKKFDLALRDRVLIFQDGDGDGKPEERKVFIDTIQRLTGIEVGLGGVWLICPPQLLFVPDKNGDDVPDGPPQVVLEGFDVPAENYHNVANGLKWGPDGWLYGRCGASSPGMVRNPESAPSTAIPLAGGIWRYHPKSKVFEPLSHGTTNPWGHDWNEKGEVFFVNSVNGHLWQMIPGAHYRRPHTLSPNPLVYEPMEMHADHWHWDTGKDWTDSRKSAGEHDRLGGGHAHSGAMIYLGEQWPREFRGNLLTLNLHGRRANVEKLERSGTGYVGRRAPDTFFASDPFFRGIDLSYGPDGSVFVLDWNDTGECHENSGVVRSSGRIYRVKAGNPAIEKAPDLRSRTIPELVGMFSRKNEWFVRQARRELANRVEAGTSVEAIRPQLMALLDRHDDTLVRLRGLWALQTLGLTDEAMLLTSLGDPDEAVRTWAIRLLSDAWPIDTPFGISRASDQPIAREILDRFVQRAENDESGLVRLALASTLQRLPISDRTELASKLILREADVDDPNQQALLWYGLIPVALKDPTSLISIAVDGRFPRVRKWITRRFAEVMATTPKPLDGLLAMAADRGETVRRDVIEGMTAGLAGTRKAEPPTHWKSFSKVFSGPDADVFRSSARNLDVVFGDGRALDVVRRLALDGKAELEIRKAALRSLIEARPADLRAICETLLRERFLNTVALQGLTQFDDPAVGSLLAKSYKTFHPSERALVIEALASRPTFARELLDQMAKGQIPRSELTASQARQIRGFQISELTASMNKVWGELRDSPKDKADLIAGFKQSLTAETLKSADRSHGRGIFSKTCASCHRLFGSGAEIGPDLTGAGRKDLDYLLSNVVDPSAVVNKDFQLTILGLKDGRVLSGILVGETDRAVTLQTSQARLAVAREDIEERTSSPLSLMPDGLLQPLSPVEVRDLIAYLMSDSQVDSPPKAKE